MFQYERSVRAVTSDCRCSACEGLIHQGSAAARIRVNLWGKLWKTLLCCVVCCEKAHSGSRPFNRQAFRERVHETA